jgi:hypothetical protein
MSATYRLRNGVTIRAYADGYHLRTGIVLPDGAPIAVAVSPRSAVACEGATAEAARIAAGQVIAGWRAATNQGAA